jgi:hypothetical protein
MNASCPISCREEAARQQRLADEHMGRDWKKFRVHSEEASRLSVIAAQLEADAAREQAEPAQVSEA